MGRASVSNLFISLALAWDCFAGHTEIKHSCPLSMTEVCWTEYMDETQEVTRTLPNTPGLHSCFLCSPLRAKVTSVDAEPDGISQRY